MKLIVIDICISNGIFCGGGELYEGIRLVEDIIKVIKWFLIKIIALFRIFDLVDFCVILFGVVLYHYIWIMIQVKH